MMINEGKNGDLLMRCSHNFTDQGTVISNKCTVRTVHKREAEYYGYRCFK